MDRGAWRATVHRVTKSRTRLKQLRCMHTGQPVTDSSMALICRSELSHVIYFQIREWWKTHKERRELLCIWANHDPATGHKITKEEMILQGTI